MSVDFAIHPDNRKPILPLTAVGGFLLIRYVMSAQSAFASGGGSPGSVNQDVKDGIDQAIATAKALSPLALACLSVALVPWASMLTLKFINMVLSRV